VDRVTPGLQRDNALRFDTPYGGVGSIAEGRRARMRLFVPAASSRMVMRIASA